MRRGKIKVVGLFAVIFILAVLAGIFVFLSDRHILGKVIGVNDSEYAPICGAYSMESPSGASASSMFEDEALIYEPFLAIDKDSSTYWKGDGSLPQWIAFSFNELRCIKGVELRLDGNSQRYVVDVEVSDDGDNWALVASDWVIENTSLAIKNFNEIAGGYIKIIEKESLSTESKLSEISVNTAPFEYSSESIIITDYCGDTDGGKIYDFRGIINSSGLATPVEDVCINSTILKEYYCSEVTPFYEEVNCPYGCASGICISNISKQNGENSLFEKSSEEIALEQGSRSASVKLLNESQICGDYSRNSPKSVYASSTFTGYNAKRAIDNDISTGWYGKYTEQYPKKIVFDLGEKKCVRAVDLYFAIWDIPITFDVQVSNDGSHWNTALSKEYAENPREIGLSFPLSIVTRYVRVVETSGARNFGNIQEFRVLSADYLL